MVHLTQTNKQEEVEQAELEQAIAMSLALEAKRVEHATLQDIGSSSGSGTRSTGSEVGRLKIPSRKAKVLQ